MWHVIVVEVGSLFGSRVGAVYVPVSCSIFFPPVVSGGLHIFKVGWLLVSPHSCLKWFSSALRFEALSCWRCGAQRPLILSMCCIAGLFAPKWAVVVYFDKWQDDRWAFSLRTRLVLAALEVVYPFGSSVLYGLLVKSVSTV